MFGGIIKEIAKVVDIQKSNDIIKLKIYAPIELQSAVVNDSIAINGVCLTIVQIQDNIATFDILPETIRRTNLFFLEINKEVNIEKSLKLGSTIGGHILQGHIDEAVTIKDIKQDGEALDICFQGSKDYVDMIVEKAYVALDGVSLTVTSVNKDTFSVMIIPHTKDNTIIKNWDIGSSINLEIDITNKSIYKYIKMLQCKL